MWSDLGVRPGISDDGQIVTFYGNESVDIDGDGITGPGIFASVDRSTGGRALVPDLPGIGEVPYLTNSSMMEVDFLPEHLIVVGGSYIGLEFAQMYRRFGSRVTVVEYGDRLIAREDRDVSKEVQAILEREGIVFHFSVPTATVGSF